MQKSNEVKMFAANTAMVMMFKEIRSEKKTNSGK